MNLFVARQKEPPPIGCINPLAKSQSGQRNGLDVILASCVVLLVPPARRLAFRLPRGHVETQLLELRVQLDHLVLLQRRGRGRGSRGRHDPYVPGT